MNPTVQAIRRFAAALVGILFVVSGLLKIIDPVGTMLIVTEYCKFFHIGFLIPAAKGIGIVLATLEALLGIALITGVLRKVAAVCAYVMLGVFTVITLVLWIVNPVMDCGCFGQAVHLTHAQRYGQAQATENRVGRPCPGECPVRRRLQQYTPPHSGFHGF